jgi:hypothetical protein
MLADLCNYHLNEKEKARNLYNEMLIRHPGSIYIEESRKLYRELLEIYPEKETEFGKEDVIPKAIEENEFE